MEMTAAEVKEQAYHAFGDLPRPRHFTNYQHCEECAVHDETLRSHDPRTISYEELGNPGWDPICFALPQAFLYYFPALVRLALDGRDRESYLDQFLFHVTYEGEESRFFKHFSREQRQVTLTTLCYIRERMKTEVAECMLGEQLTEAVDLWEKLVEDP